MDENDVQKKNNDVLFSVVVTLFADVIFFGVDIYSGYCSGYYVFNNGFQKAVMDIVRVLSGYISPSIIALAVTFMRDSTTKKETDILKIGTLGKFIMLTIIYAVVVFCCYIQYDFVRAIVIFIVTILYIIISSMWMIDKSKIVTYDNTGRLA